MVAILEAIGPRLGIRDPVSLEGMPVVVSLPAPDDDEELDEVLAAASGRKPYPVTADGIAVISISGSLVKKASWLDAESGLQSYETICEHVEDARDDPRNRPHPR